MTKKLLVKASIAILVFAPVLSAKAADDKTNSISKIISAQIASEMQKLQIPGMSVGIFIDGKEYIFNLRRAITRKQKASHRFHVV